MFFETQTLLSELLVIIKGKVLLCNVAVFMSIGWHRNFGLLSWNAEWDFNI